MSTEIWGLGPICECEPFVLDSKEVKGECDITGPAEDWDLSEFQEEGYLPEYKGAKWRIVELNYHCANRHHGNVDEDGTLEGMPDSVDTKYCYLTPMELQIGCPQEPNEDGEIEFKWPQYSECSEDSDYYL